MKLTQGTKIIRLLKENKKTGVPNWKLATVALKYTSVISDLRKDGYGIVAERQMLPNGRPSNTYNYHLVSEPEK